MIWVTRSRPKTDRVACSWLIRRFIDPQAEIVFAKSEDVLGVAQRMSARSFDAPGADFTHAVGEDGHELCSFETMLDHFALRSDRALERLARIVHAADIRSDRSADDIGAGVAAIGEGGLDVEVDDAVLVARASFVYDALYAWCQRDVAGA